MAKISNYKAISYSDYSEEAAEIMEDLADILNPFMREVTDAVNGNLDFENLSQNIIEIQVTVDSNGIPNLKKINVGKKSVKGLQVINTRNLTKTTTYPSSTPFISHLSNGDGTVTLNHISGLPSNNKFVLTIIVY